MSFTAHDPRLLYSVDNIQAFYIQDGEENELTPSGPQSLSLLMVPTRTTYPASQTAASYASEISEEDFYLHLHLPPELDMPLPATIQIFHQHPNNYLIPRWDLAPEQGAFIRIQFPDVGRGPNTVTQEDIDTFESILAQCTAFMPHASQAEGHAKYNPAEYAPGEGYISSSSADVKPGQSNGKIVLVDEEDGSVVGELTDGYDILEKPGVKPGSKSEYYFPFYFLSCLFLLYRIRRHEANCLDPVEIQLPAEGEGNKITVDNVSEEYLQMAQHPAYKDSRLVQQSAEVSRLIVTGSSYLANILTSGADSFTRKTKPNPKPLTFSETTHARMRKIGDLSHSAASFSSKTVKGATGYAQNLGAMLARNKDTSKRTDPSGKVIEHNKPGILNKSLIAFSTIADGIEQGARNVLQTGSLAATTMVEHRYGSEAGSVAKDFARGFTNVGLVYIDATGVNRKAFLKSVAKGMIVGRLRNGKRVLVGSGDGGGVPPDAVRPSSSRSPHRTPPPVYGTPGTSLSEPFMAGGKNSKQ